MIIEEIEESIKVKQQILKSEIPNSIDVIADLIIEQFKNGKKLLLAGNGGSAGDSQHLATEFVARFETNRIALPAIALSTDSSLLTAIGNDFSFENIFSRQIEALGNKGDIFIAISTSGNSKNIVKAVEIAKQKQLITVSLTGQNGGKIAKLTDYAIQIPSSRTSRIQEAHIMVGHILCSTIEKNPFIKKLK
jgi:D-sedoheptulose 7-phosphate isomerase